jgi:hypothetical protein
MNSLRDYLTARRFDPTHALNLLQDHGIISDLCVTPEDVGDAGRAITWLSLRESELKTSSVPSVSSVVK